jgi:pyruvate dehydrogenase E1 component alpha subunit
MKNRTKEELIEFEQEMIKYWEAGRIPYPCHFSGGNEEQLIKIFKKIKPGDYIFSTHRSHYHYLLAGGTQENLKKMILEGNSMHIFDKELNFFTSAIVAGCHPIAVGVALALKKQNSNRHVWCFVGDGAEDEGHFYEAVKYVDGWDLPCTFVIEDNNLSVETPKEARWNKVTNLKWPKCVIRYKYVRTYPHVGTNKWVDFGKEKSGGPSF